MLLDAELGFRRRSGGVLREETEELAPEEVAGEG